MRVPRVSALQSISGICASPSAAERARGIAEMLEREQFPMPFVFPTDIGGIQFEWRGEGRELNLEFPPDGSHLSFLKIVDGKTLQEGEIAGNLERQVNSLLEWMVST